MSFVKLVISCSVFSENPLAAISEYIAFISSITYARLDLVKFSPANLQKIIREQTNFRKKDGMLAEKTKKCFFVPKKL